MKAIPLSWLVGLLALCPVLSPQSAVSAETAIYAVTKETTLAPEHQDTQNGREQLKKDEKESDLATVTFAPTWFSYQTKFVHEIYDFSKKQLIALDDKARTYEPMDLHALVYFRIAESQNRKMLGNILGQAKIPGGGFAMGSEPELETYFGIVIPGWAKPKIEEHQSGNGDKYAINGKTVTEVSWSDHAIDAVTEKNYEHFLAYELHMHPEIRGMIAAHKQFPSSIQCKTISARGGGTETVKMELKEFTPGGDNALPIPADYTEKRPLLMKPIRESLSKLGSKPKLPDKSELSAYCDSKLKKGDVLDAFLAVCEQGWMTSDNLIVQMGTLKTAIQKDPRCEIVIANLSPPNKDEMQKAVADLEKMDRTNVDRAEALDVILANNLQSLGRTEEAQKHMCDALIKNPLLVGAYLDLFQILCARYDVVTAWDASNMAKQLNPKYPRVEESEQMESKMEKDFPVFF